MRLKFDLVAFLLLFLILFSSIPLVSSENSNLLILSETRIPTNVSWKNWPAIYEDRIVWMDHRNDNDDVYMYNLSTHTETQITNNISAGLLWDSGVSIYDDKIVWQDLRNRNYNIYLYNLSTHKETQITTSGLACFPDIYKDIIVWEDYRHGGSDIYMYDLSTSLETRIITSGAASEPDVYGDKIVWAENSSGNYDIYVYDLSTNKKIQITTNKSDQLWPNIFEDKIVWEDHRNDSSDVYMYDFSTSTETQITNDDLNDTRPKIYGDRIIWGVSEGFSSSVYVYDLSTHEKTEITGADDPAIYDNRIVWLRYLDFSTPLNTELYVSTLSPSLKTSSLNLSSPSNEYTSLNNTSTVKSTANNFWKRVDALTDSLSLERILTILASIVTILAFIRSFPTTSHKKPKIISFEVNPAKIVSGSSTTLNWSVSDATHVTITPGIGNLALTGSISVSPAKTTNYTLTAINEAGENSITRKVIVENNSAKDSSASIT